MSAAKEVCRLQLNAASSVVCYQQHDTGQQSPAGHWFVPGACVTIMRGTVSQAATQMHVIGYCKRCKHNKSLSGRIAFETGTQANNRGASSDAFRPTTAWLDMSGFAQAAV